MQPTKIQINSLEALERLIGGSTEAEIEIRSSIAAAFAEKHLKGMVRQMAEAGLTESVRTLIANEMLQTIPDPTVSSYYNRTVQVLKPAVREALKGELDKVVAVEIKHLLQEQRIAMREQIETGLQAIATDTANKLLPELQDDYITQLVTKKINTLLAATNAA